MRRAPALLVSSLVFALAAALALVAVTRAPPQQPMALDEGALPRDVPALGAAEAPGSIDELRARVASVLEREGVPGAAIALVGREGPIWVGGVGVADAATGQPVDAATVFRVASITKSIVGLGVMRLVEQGRLELDQPLRALVPDAAIDNAWEGVAPVTLAQALEHTAGLDDMRFNETSTEDDALSPAAALAINPRSRKIRWRPGSRMSYSNVGYTLAARAIEVVTGEPFDAWLRREVIAPLGMGAADFRRTEALAPRLATGYIDRGRAVPFTPIAHRPAGALLASATDVARLVQFWLRRGAGHSEIVSPAGLDRIERTGTLAFPRTDIDYGLGNYGDVGHPVRARGHDGGWPGFVSSMRYFPELGLGYVVLLNATHSLRAYVEIRQLVFAYLVRERALPSSPEPAACPAEAPGAAFFAYANPRSALFGFVDRALLGWRATAIDGGVRLEPLIGPSLDLVPAADGGYRHPSQSGSSVRFSRDRDGVPVTIAGFAYGEAAPYGPARARLIALSIAVLLLHLAPLWAVAALGLAILRRRRPVAVGLTLWPAIAGLCLFALPHLLSEAFLLDVIGVVHPLTIGICGVTILFAFASGAGVLAALRWSWRPDRPSVWRRLVPTAMAAAALALALWLGANGLIGLRTWAW